MTTTQLMEMDENLIALLSNQIGYEMEEVILTKTLALCELLGTIKMMRQTQLYV